MTAVYLDTPEQWTVVADYCTKTGVIGFDTETYGHNVLETSPAYLAKIHVWSISLYADDISGGFRRARGAVLPVEALPHFFGVFLNPEVVKVAHNSRHDLHALANHGLLVQNVVDTLELVRLAYPERALDPTLGFRLKPLAMDLLAKPKRDAYADLTKASTTVKVETTLKVCACGEKPCRKKKAPEHAKMLVTNEEWVEQDVEYALEEIVPGHPHWTRLVEYAAADAVDALELYALASYALDHTYRPQIPWEMS